MYEDRQSRPDNAARRDNIKPGQPETVKQFLTPHGVDRINELRVSYHEGWRRFLGVLFCLIGVLTQGTASDITSALQRAPVLNPNYSAFPEGSLLDRSHVLDAPAGKYGFVTVDQGHFVFENGKRARFFGVNLAKDSVFIDKPLIDRVVALFARSGVNLVRIHHIDDTQGILDPEPSRYFRPDKLDLVDYWVAKLKERGIYVCLDLNDYRTFRASEGAVDGERLGRGAKPYAVFDPSLIALQQEYARKFLVEHMNPYTRLAYADDPAIAFIELYDENGLFIRRADWPNLVQPYREALRQEWNAWLSVRYRTTEGLRAAWTNSAGACALKPGELLEDASVQLPRMDMPVEAAMTFTDPLLAPARVSEGALFAYEMQTRYLKTMRKYLRDKGVKVPITAVGAQDVLPDLMATAATTDYIGINYYWDHPCWQPGKEWTMPSYFSLKSPLNYGTDYTFPVTVSLARMHGKPLVVRELGYCFPNPYRGVGMLEAAAYGAFLDIDALILFTYDANPRTRTIGYFDIHLDPVRWGLISQAARLFSSGEIQPSTASVGIAYSQVDAFTWQLYQSPLYHLAFAARVENYTDMLSNPHPFSLLITSGRSCGGVWPTSNLLMFANARHTDLRFQQSVPGPEVRHGYTLQTGRGGVFDFTFNGLGFNSGTMKQAQAWPSFSAADLMAKGYFPIATNDTAALGFLDPARKVIGFHNLRPTMAIRFAVDAVRDWGGAPISHADLDAERWRTSSQQITRFTTDGVLRIDTPTFQAVSGQYDNQQLLSTSAVKMSTPTAVGTFTAESLDGKPLAEATRLLVKMVSRARNAGVKVIPEPTGPKPHKLTTMGQAPITTDGSASETPTRVVINGKSLVEVYLQNGTWEYLAEQGRGLLYVDTGNITVKFPRTPKLVRWYTLGDPVEYEPTNALIPVPEGVRYTEFIWE